MISIDNFISEFVFPTSVSKNKNPWEITDRLKEYILQQFARLNSEYVIKDDIAVHKSAVIEKNVTFKAPVLIMKNAVISANSYFREGVIIGQNTKIGPGSEIKSSIIGHDSAIAHFNYIGNSIIGSWVNFEAGAIAANHFNERKNKEISVLYKNNKLHTGIIKFGSLVGDHCKIGANAVLSPGTILEKNTIVGRLELVEQSAL